MPMTRSEAAAVASRASAEKRRRAREDEMIKILRSRGRLVDLYEINSENVDQAFEAVDNLNATPADMRSMLNFLCGYNPRGVIDAVRYIERRYRDAVSGGQHDPDCTERCCIPPVPEVRPGGNR